MFTPNYMCCPLMQKLTSFVIYVSKSYMVCPLSLTQLDFLVMYSHVPSTCGHTYHFIFRRVIL
ncbi:hypothetical protein Hanom_Chr01g00069011 [Helianthus anomalus]